LYGALAMRDPENTRKRDEGPAEARSCSLKVPRVESDTQAEMFDDS
jgi:hypothetical protein